MFHFQSSKFHNYYIDKIIILALKIQSKVKINHRSGLGILIHSDFGMSKNSTIRDSKLFHMEQLMAGIISIVANAKINSVVNFDDESSW